MSDGNSVKLDREIDTIVSAYDAMSHAINPLVRLKLGIDLTLAQFKVLMGFELQGRYTMTDLRRENAVTVSTMTSMVDRMTQNNMLKREQDRNDRRIVLVSLTSKGKKVLNRLLYARRKVLESFLYTLDENEVKRFSRAMNDAAYFLSRAREEIRTSR